MGNNYISQPEVSMPPWEATYEKSYHWNPCIMLQIRKLHQLKESGPFPNTSIVYVYFYLGQEIEY